MKRKRSKQQSFVFRTLGGKRRGAGRKPDAHNLRGGRAGVRHRVREKLATRFPVHITLRFCADLPKLRTHKRAHWVRRVIAASHKDHFRICEYSIQGTHLHMICEARNAEQLSRGMQGFGVRLAGTLNRKLDRKGAVFADRYHVRILRTPRQTRHALSYVIHNAHRHRVALPPMCGGVDPYSSGWTFDGWRDHRLKNFAIAPPDDEGVVAAAHTWMLGEGWRRHGLLRADEMPGPRRR